MIHHSFYLLESYCCLCLIVTFVSYTSILFKFRFGAHPQRHCAAALRQRKLTVTLFITTLVSLLLWLPYSIFLFVNGSTYIISNSLFGPERIRLLFSLNSLRYANSLVNPILYTIRMPDFKKLCSHCSDVGKEKMLPSCWIVTKGEVGGISQSFVILVSSYELKKWRRPFMHVKTYIRANYSKLHQVICWGSRYITEQ